jgi:hypothetical protein
VRLGRGVRAGWVTAVESDAERVAEGVPAGAPAASQTTYATPSEKARTNRPTVHFDPFNDLLVKVPPFGYVQEIIPLTAKLVKPV